jgi:hypothetical protein
VADDFDPYYTWLGIPPDEQPPNAYRLLGVQVFESDDDVIANAADRVMGYVRTFSAGKRGPIAEKLLNEISAARVLLLNKEKKRACDRELAATLAARSPPAATQPAVPAARVITIDEPAPAAPGPLAARAERQDPAATRGPAVRRSANSAARARQRGNPAVVLAAGAVVAVVLAIVAAFAITAIMSNGQPGSAGRRSPDPAPTGPRQLTTPAIPPPPLPLPAPGGANDPVPGEARDVPPPGGVDSTLAEENPFVPVPSTAPAAPPAESEKRLLLIFPPTEMPTAWSACNRYGLEGTSGTFDSHIADLSHFHAIVGGSNSMDYWGNNETRKRPEAFQPYEDFVTNGGHFVMLGAWNGRNMEHMRRFGIRTGATHNAGFLPVPDHTDVLFQGVEDIVPADGRMRSAGHFSVTVPHVVLLYRNEPGNPPRPALATIPHGKGRVTFSQVEPHWRGDQWLITVLVAWIARGSPTGPFDGKPSLPPPAAEANRVAGP